MTKNELLTIRAVTDAAELGALREEWDQLLLGSRTGSICLTWEWVCTWWEIFGGPGLELYVLLLRAENRLVGIAPFVVITHRERGLLKVRTLRFLGTGEPEWEETASEYLDVIAAGGYEKPVADRVWSHLQSCSRQWDQIVFNDVMGDSLVISHLKERMLQAGMRPRQIQIGTRYCIDLPSSWEAYLNMLEPGTRKRFQYKRRKLEKAGHVEERGITSPEDVGPAFKDLVRLHTMRWISRGGRGVFASERFVAFHEKLMHRLLERGMLNIRLLSFDGAAISALYNFRYGGTDYFYQAGFDTGNASRYSPGIVAHNYAIEDAIRQGMKKYDFMKGGTVSYKSEFACNESPVYEVEMSCRTFTGSLLDWQARLRVIWRRIRGKSHRRQTQTDQTGIPARFRSQPLGIGRLFCERNSCPSPGWRALKLMQLY